MLLEEPENTPYEESPAPSHAGRTGILTYVLLAIAAIYVIASLYLLYDMRGRLTALEQKEQTLETAQVELNNRIHATSSEFKQALSSEVGMTKQEIAQRAAELERQQKASAAKLAAAQSQQGQQIAAVNTEVSGVKTEVGAAKTDIQKTQTDLAATNAKLEHAMGDLGVQSGLIAHNSSELEMLKRKGERNYYDFTLAEERAHAGLDHQPATEESGPQEEQVYDERDCGRSYHREEGPHAAGAATVLHRTRPHAVRGGGFLGGQEQHQGILEYAEGSTDAGDAVSWSSCRAAAHQGPRSVGPLLRWRTFFPQHDGILVVRLDGDSQVFARVELLLVTGNDTSTVPFCSAPGAIFISTTSGCVLCSLRSGYAMK